jgi:hypothetical protein
MKQTEKKSTPVKFSGVARSVQCYDHEGYRNFRICRMTIKDGIVTRIEYSDPFASFELIAKLELEQELAIHNLNSNWLDGKTLER